MSKSDEQKQQVTEQSHDDIDLRGTLFFVSIIGIFILLSWLGVWSIFISR